MPLEQPSGEGGGPSWEAYPQGLPAHRNRSYGGPMGDGSDIRGDVRRQIREFLATRRARIKPDSCEPRQDATHMTATSLTSSGSFPRAARSSGSAEHPSTDRSEQT